MSLVGSLEDLSLGDILQIISLSQKSGVLALKTTGSDGRIVFVDGLVRGAAIKGGPQDLQGLLVSGGFMTEDEFRAAVEHAESRGCPIVEAAAEVGSLPAERIESLCREAIESAVVTMFSWSKGDFSFDVRSEPAPGDPEILAPNGVNAQYLAMEGARLRDEGGASAGSSGDREQGVGASFDEMSAHEMFGVTPESSTTAASSPAGDGATAGSSQPGASRMEDLTSGMSSRASVLAAEIMALGAAVSVDAEAGPEEDEESSGFELEELEEVDEVEEIDLDRPIAADDLALDDPDDDGLFDDGDADEPEAILAAEEESVIDLEPAVDLASDADLPLASESDLVAPLELEPVADEPHPESADETSSGRSVAATSAGAPARTRKAAGNAARSDGPTADVDPLVVVDRDLIALEWVKDALKDEFKPIHIFQQTEQAMTRIRQYLVRGESPVVLVAPDIDVDRLGGVVDPVDFVSRLKAQSPRLVALWLRSEGGGGVTRMGSADGAVVRPDGNALRAPNAGERLAGTVADFARQVRIDVSGAPRDGAAPPRAGRPISPDALRKLRDATRALTEASSRGEVLPLVIRFAAEIFDRVAMFLVRDGTAVGMAQRGLPSAGGPDDRELRELAFSCASSAWLAMVLEEGKPVRGAPGNDGDRDFAGLLGDRVPAQAYLAPIESTGQVIAVLYGDNLPEDEPLGDTSALEVVLHHAGLALDRAALERALHEGVD